MGWEQGHTPYNSENYQDYVLVTESVLDQVADKDFKRGLARFLKEERPKGTSFPQMLWKKVEEVINSPDPGSVFSHLGKDERIAIVIEAVEKGYISNFTLETPWHPARFLSEDEPTTYPHQHSSIIAYRGTNRNMFFSRRYSDDEDSTRHPESVLNTGYISPGIRTGAQQDGVFGKPGVWVGFLDTARRFALQNASDERNGAPVVLETQLPANENLFTAIGHKNKHPEEYNNLKELKDAYSPEELREIAQESIKPYKSDYGTFRGRLSFRYEGKVPLKWVRRIWDVEMEPNEVLWESKKQYLSFLKSEMPEKIPGTPESVSAPDIKPKKFNKHVRKEYKEWRKIARSIYRMKSLTNRIKFDAGTTDRLEKLASGKPEKALVSLAENYIESYSNKKSINHEDDINLLFRGISSSALSVQAFDLQLERLGEELDDFFDKDIQFQRELNGLINIQKELDNLQITLDEIVEEMKSIMNEERGRMSKDDWNPMEEKEEFRFEQKVENRIVDDLTSLPRLVLNPRVKEASKIASNRWDIEYELRKAGE